MSKLMDKFKGLLSKKKEATAHVGSLCSDSLSAYYQVDYETPAIVVDFLKNEKKFVEEKIKNMSPDVFNDSFLDTYVDNLIELAKDDLNLQRTSHERAILDIKMGQITKVQLYKNELEKINEEIEELKMEMVKV